MSKDPRDAVSNLQLPISQYVNMSTCHLPQKAVIFREKICWIEWYIELLLYVENYCCVFVYVVGHCVNLPQIWLIMTVCFKIFVCLLWYLGKEKVDFIHIWYSFQSQLGLDTCKTSFDKSIFPIWLKVWHWVFLTKVNLILQKWLNVSCFDIE